MKYMMMVFGYTPAVFLAVFSTYYGIAVGRYSVEAILDKVEIAAARAIIFLKVANNKGIINVLIKYKQQLIGGVSTVCSDITKYRYETVVKRQTVYRLLKFVSAISVFVSGILVGAVVVSFLLAVQLNEYQDVFLSQLAAPVLISIFGYTVEPV